MRSPTESAPILILEEATSTQTVAAELLRDPNQKAFGAVFAHHQSAGKGRFDRFWHSVKGESLTASLIFREYVDHPRPWLIGMTVAVAAASVIHARIRWPNDLVIRGKKLGGILTDMVTNLDGRRIPVVGIGINIGQSVFPEPIAEIATSLRIEGRTLYDPLQLLEAILVRLPELPNPASWGALEPAWRLFDDTPGKVFRLPSGEEAIAQGIGPNGELICAVDGETRTVLAAEAMPS